MNSVQYRLLGRCIDSTVLSISEMAEEIDKLTEELGAARSRIAELEEYITGLECIDRRGALGGRDE